MRRLILLLMVMTMAAPAVAEDMRRRVIAGDRIMMKGIVIQLRDTECPPETTKEGREAKRIMRIMLFARKLECSYTPGPKGNVGDCLYGPSVSSKKGRSMAEELKRRNLCQPFGRT